MKRMNFFNLFCAVIICAASILILIPFSISAEDSYPSGPIKMIDPWPPGGGVDIVGRIIASVGQEYIGQPLIMKYVAGAAGVRGAEAVSRSDADGYSIGLLGYGAIVNQVVANPANAPYKKEDFIFIAQISSNPCVLVANKNAPFKTLAEMVSYIKANPGKVIYSSSGQFGFVHTAFARLIKAAGLEKKMIHLPTKGGAAAAKECLGGHTMVTGGTPGVVVPHIRAGNFIPLAVCDTDRLAELPDVPTVKEALGVDVVPTTFWVAPCVPKGTPDDRVELLRGKFGEIMKNKSVLKLASRTGDRFVYLTGDQMQDKWDTEWRSAKELIPIFLEK